MQEIPSKKQKNPGLVLLDEIFLQMQKDAAESHFLPDAYSWKLRDALVLASKYAIEYVVLSLGELEVVDPLKMPTEEDIRLFVDEVTRHPK